MSKQQSIQDMERLIEDVHKNAVAHGWWDKPPSFPEILALCHSELSEALEEYRNGNPPLYGTCAGGSKSCEHYYNCDRHEPEGCKPEGAAVELADCILRIFDYCAYAQIDIMGILQVKHEYNKYRPYKHGGKTI